jgi:predicted transcriptional regulator
VDKKDYRKATVQVHQLLERAAKEYAKNPTDIKRLALANKILQEIVKPCSRLLETMILIDNTKGLTLSDSNFYEEIEDIKTRFIEIDKLSKQCDENKSQLTW